MTMNPELHRKMVDFLMNIPALQSEGGRHALLLTAGLGGLIPNINCWGSTTEFVSLLINYLYNYGTVNGELALVSFLKEVGRGVGENHQIILKLF